MATPLQTIMTKTPKDPADPPIPSCPNLLQWVPTTVQCPCMRHPAMQRLMPLDVSRLRTWIVHLLTWFLVEDFNESDYEPTIDHAKSHQSRLSISAQNKRLASEAEIKAQEEAAAHKLATIKEVEIKVRYPDQSQVVSKFSATDTAAILYGFVRSMLEYGQEPFLLSYASSRGPKIIPRDDSSKSLIRDLGFDGRVLVNLIWDEKASLEARLGGTTLKKEFAAAAKEIKVEEVKPAPGVEGDRQATEAVPDKPQHSSGKGGKGGIPKWLKLPGKK